ncbi:MAG: von Willebrand factor type A domain-containing protein [Myxococcota bacterium]
MVRSIVVLVGALLLVASPSISGATGAASRTTGAEPSPAVSTGRITGVVRNRQGEPVSGATVSVLCSCLDRSRTVKTGKDGTYRFDGLPPGVYSVRVTMGKADVVRHLEVREGEQVEAVVEVRTHDKQRAKKAKPSKKKRKAKSRKAESRPSVSPPVRRKLETKFKNSDVDAILNPSSAGRYSRRRASRGHASRISAAPMRAAREPANREAYAHIDENGFRRVTEAPLSTFSADVDTASYSNMRRFLGEGRRPPADAIRIEELINYFEYDYKPPTGERPVAVNWELGPCPWNADNLLVHIGLKSKPIASAKVPPRNLVFLLDVSGSMHSPDKLPLLKRSMGLLVDQLREQDRVSIVVYAGASGLVLPPTSGAQRSKIREAIFALQPGGSTNGAAGIRLAYQMAQDAFIDDGINRVILATDGDFNVGTTSDGDLTRLIEDKRKTGVFLSVLGFGTGNIQDTKMELLADKGNGNYAYIDDLHEGRKVLVQQAGATLVTVAKDVKLQVEFNPVKVAEYRLVGYENRRLRDEDFNDDTKDAGEMGAGHTVTVLYEIVPAGSKGGKGGTGKPPVDPLKYQAQRVVTGAAKGDELMTVKVRFKRPKSQKSRLLAVPVKGPAKPALDRTSNNFRFAAAVTELGMLLRNSPHKGTASFEDAKSLARGAKGADPHGYRQQFIDLVEQARGLR